MRLYLILGGAAATLIALCSASPGAANDVFYVPRVVARSGDIYGNRVTTGVGCPDINDHGALSYPIYTPLGEGLATSDGILLFKGDMLSGVRILQFGVASLSNSGDVAFAADYDDGTVFQRSGIFTQHGAVALVGDEIGGIRLLGFSSQRPDINSSDEVVFSSGNLELDGLFTQHRLIAKTGDVIGGARLTTPNKPSINENGDVVFSATSPDISVGAFAADRILAAPGMLLDGKLVTDVRSGPIINDHGDTAVHVDYFQGSGVFVNGDAVVVTGNTISGKRINRIGVGSITMNALKEIAFKGFYSGGVGVFTENELIVGSGELFAGQTVQGMCDPAINRRGQIATALVMQNGSSMVVVFTPVPEPRGICIATILFGSAFILRKGVLRRGQSQLSGRLITS